MSLEHELRQLFGETEGAPWPGEREAFDRFLHRRARRGRAVVAAAGLALVALLGAAVLVARLLPQDRETIAPAGGVVRVPEQGFELPIPAGWKVRRQLTGSGSQAVGVVLVPRSGQPAGAAITVAADPDRPGFYRLDLQQSASQRADGRLYKLRPASAGWPTSPAPGKGAVGQYAIAWPAWPGSCLPLPAPAEQPPACAAWRVLLVTGSAAPGDTAGSQQVQHVMRQIVTTVRPIGNAVHPPTPTTALPPTKALGVPPNTKLLLGKGGSGRGAWEAWIEPTPLGIGGRPGFMVRFPRATPKPTWQWHSPEPQSIQRDGVSMTHVACLSWLPGADLVLSGLAREDAATVRIELAGRPPVEVSTFGRDQPVPWVAFVSQALAPGAKLERVIALNAAGKTIGTQRPFQGNTLCPPRGG
jgi:hypothetical protein